MHPSLDRKPVSESEVLAERVEALAAWINDVELRMRTTELATADEGTARELRRAIEALSKHDPKLEERLTDRVDVLADRVETLSATVSTTASALAGKDGEIAALRRLLEEESKKTAALATGGGRGGAEEIEALSRRFEASQARVDALVGELRHALESMPGERRAERPGSRLESLEARLDALESRAEAALPEPADEAIAHLRGLIDGLRMRLAASERELAALSGSQDVVARLDELTWRLAALERGDDRERAPLTLVPDSDRSRADLRTLELRMERAEAAERETRAAFLSQLERLAARVEWRLARLEPDHAAGAFQEAVAGGARIVPLRNSER